MAQKFLIVDANGNLAELEATTVSTGSADAGDVVALNSDGKIDPSMLPTEAISPEVVNVVANEDLNAGDIVYLFDDNGVVKCAKALADDINKCGIGFVKDSVTANGNVNVYFEGIISGKTGLTPGSVYFLSDTTAGDVSSTPPNVVGHVIQRVGIAISPTEIQFERNIPIVKG